MSPVTVATGETPQSAGIATSTGTMFIPGVADQGPATPTLCQSLGRYVTVYGPRTPTSATLYDSVEAAFALGVASVWVVRVTNESAVAAKKVLLDSGSKPTIVATYKTPGVAGNAFKIEVVISGGEYEINLLNTEGELIETTGKLSTQAQALAFSSSLVTFTQSTESEHTSNAPKALAAAALTGGANPSGLTEASYVSALASFPRAYGPGQVIIPGQTGTTVNTALATHARENNRWAFGDLADSPAPATLISSKGSISAGLAGYIAFQSSSAIIPSITPGSTRTVRGCVISAALCAQVSATGNDNQAPAGRDWTLAPYVQGFTNTFTPAQQLTLSEAGINSFTESGGILCLNGFASALPFSLDKIYNQASAGRERMRLVSEAETIAEEFEFKTLDGRKHQLAKFQGRLQALIAREWEQNALFGERLFEAGVANVEAPINTPATAEAGELNAELRVRISKFAEHVSVLIVSVPIAESVGA